MDPFEPGGQGERKNDLSPGVEMHSISPLVRGNHASLICGLDQSWRARGRPREEKMAAS